MITSTIIVACRGQRRWFDLDAVRTAHQEEGLRERLIGTSDQRDQARVAVGLSSGAGFVGMNPAGAPPLDWHHDAPEPGVIVLGEPPDDQRDDPVALAVKIIDCMCPRAVCRVCGVPRTRRGVGPQYVPQAELAAHIKERRQAAGVTQAEVNRWLGYKRVAENYERTDDFGATIPSPKDWPLLKERLGLDDRFDDVVNDTFDGHYVDGDGEQRQAQKRTPDSIRNNKDTSVLTRVAPVERWSDCGHNAYRKGRVFDPYHNPVIEAACLILDRDYVTVADLGPCAEEDADT